MWKIRITNLENQNSVDEEVQDRQNDEEFGRLLRKAIWETVEIKSTSPSTSSSVSSSTSINSGKSSSCSTVIMLVILLVIIILI